MVHAARVALIVGLAATGCFPPIDELVTGDPPLDTSRSCSLPSAELGVAVPAVFPDATFPPRTGQSHSVAPGDDLQAVIDAALSGDEIVLQAGAEYPGPIRLPFRSEPGTIVIRSSALAELAPGRTVSLEDVPRLATITASDAAAAVIADERASGWRLAGIELRPSAGVEVDSLMVVGSVDSTIAEALPSEIVIDRCLVRGDPTLGARRGIELNSRSAAVIDSAILDVKSMLPDSCGLEIDNATGPILVHNTRIEASGRNVCVGVRSPGSPELSPSDISICKSVIEKPAIWKDQGFNVKTLVEIGRARRFLAAGTLFERSWSDVFPGYGVMIQSDGAAAGVMTEDIALVDVRMRDVRFAIDVNTDGNAGSVARVLVENSEIAAADRVARLLNGGVSAFSMVHVTALAGSAVLDGGGDQNPDLLIRDGLFDMGLYGFRADNVGSGIPALDAQFAPWTVRRNILVGADENYYPADNFYPPTLFEAGVADDQGGDYRLLPTSPYAGQGSDGSDPGANIDRLEAALPAP